MDEDQMPFMADRTGIGRWLILFSIIIFSAGDEPDPGEDIWYSGYQMSRYLTGGR